MAEILVVGDIVNDIVVVPHGEPRVDTDTLSAVREVGGGSAANTAAWIGHLGGKARFVGRSHKDGVAHHTAQLKRHNVRAEIQADRTRPTASIVLLVDGDRRTMFTERGANVALDCDAVAIGRARWLHLTGYTLFGAEDDGASFARLIARAGVPFSITLGSAGFIADYGVERFRANIAGATIVFASLAEGRILTGLDYPAAVADALAADFPVVALTLGSEGVILVTEGAPPMHVGITPSTVVDPTGAGDAFTAGFLVEWVSSGDAVTAVARGTAAAATSVGVIGGRPPG
jgi:sugar/nucleoside kinase (ribokinase family)